MTIQSKNKLFIFIIALLLISNIGLVVFFMGMNKHDSRDNRGRGEITRVLKEEIGFNETQIKKYEEIRLAHREKMRPLFDSMRLAKEALYNQLYLPSLEDSALSAASIAIGEKQQIMDRHLFNHFRTLRELCTAEQQPKFDSMIKHMVQRMIIPGRRGSPGKSKTTDSTKNVNN
jgi:protein CpxP